MDEVEEKWLVDCSVQLEHASDGIQLQAQVRFIHSNDIEKEVEIKAVTGRISLLTKLQLVKQYHHSGKKFQPLKALVGIRMLYLTSRWESSGGRSYAQAVSTHFLHPGSPQHPWPQVGMLRSRPDLFPGYLIPVSLRNGSQHPDHVGARHQRPHAGTHEPLSPPQGIQPTIKTICGTGYA